MRHESVIGASLSRIVEVEPWVNDRALLRDTQLVMDRHPLSLFSNKKSSVLALRYRNWFRLQLPEYA